MRWKRPVGWWVMFALLPTPPGFAASDLHEQTRQAIQRAVDFLIQAHQPDGSFLYFGCHDEALTACRRAYSTGSMIQTPSSPILGSGATAVVLTGLLAVEDARTVALIEKGAQWLRAQMDAEGFFGHFRLLKPDVGPMCPGEFRTLSATAVNRSVLETLGISLPPMTPDLTTYQRSDGTFYPLIGYRFHFSPSDVPAIKAGGPTRARFRKQYEPLMRTYESSILKRLDVLDPYANAEVFNYLVRHEHAPAGLCDYLVRVAQQKRVSEHPDFIRSPYLFLHALSLAYRHGAQCLEPAKVAVVSRLLSRQTPDGSWGNVLDTAIATTSLTYFGYTGEALDRAVDFLLSQQQPDGSWKRAAWWEMLQWVHVRLASEEISTGYVLEALGTYVSKNQEARE